MDEPAILDRDTHPHVWGPIEYVGQLCKSLMTLGKDLKCVELGAQAISDLSSTARDCTVWMRVSMREVCAAG
jgi:hypothetical protein